MQEQVKRPAMYDETGFAKTPGLEKLGLSQAVWGTDDGWAGGTEQVLTTKRTPYTKMNHIDWAQRKKGAIPSPRFLDVMYDVKDTMVKPRSRSAVPIATQQKRETIGAEATE